MSSVAAAARAALRCGGPAALAALAWALAGPTVAQGAGGAAATDIAGLHAAASATAQAGPSQGALGGALVVAALLLCPGWGLLRVLSGVDRRFGVVGSSLCLSLLALGLLGTLGKLGTFDLRSVAFGVALALCVVGGVRQFLFDRWQRRQPPHPAPMPLWPARLPLCLALLAASLAAVSLGSRAPPSALSAPIASRAPIESSAPSAPSASPAPTTGAPASWRETGFFDAVAGTLGAAGGLSEDGSRRVVAAACLAAVLLFVAEGISRLRGNRGAPLAMLALLLGYQPLGALLAVLAAGGPWSAEHAAEALRAAVAEGSLSAALAPFLHASPLALALAFAAMLLSATLSVLRRASYHVPRLAGAAAFGLVLALPGAACVLLPGWILGVLLAHRMCRAAAAADPASVATLRRAGEPPVLRAPFLPLALPIAAAGLLAFVLSGAPAPALAARPFPEACAVALALLAALLPWAVLAVPGVRQLNASPGREAYFFVGLLLGACAAGLLWDLHGVARDGGAAASSAAGVAARAVQAAAVAPGDSLARLLSLLLAVPVANGALEALARRGGRARLVLLVVVLALLPASLALLR